VVRVEKDKLTARKESGQEITLTRRQAQAFSVHEKREIEVSTGDKLLLEANRWETNLRVTNGELVTVARVDQGRIELADGRTLPTNYRTFDHGYAVTAHRSQGQTVDAVIVSGDRMSKELFYVAATRGRESLTVITSDKEQLREAIGISGERTSATELARKAEQQTQLGPRLPELCLGHGLEVSADFALWRSASLAAEEQQKPVQVIQPEITPALQRRLEEKQEMEIDHGFSIGF